MHKHYIAGGLVSLLTLACGEGASMPLETEARTSASLPLVGSLDGTWKSGGWPGIVSISGGSGYMSNNGDLCWLSGDLKFENITATATPNEYTATRYMYGSGSCLGQPPPITVKITLYNYSSGDVFTETDVATPSTWNASWSRYP